MAGVKVLSPDLKFFSWHRDCMAVQLSLAGNINLLQKVNAGWRAAGVSLCGIVCHYVCAYQRCVCHYTVVSCLWVLSLNHPERQTPEF